MSVHVVRAEAAATLRRLARSLEKLEPYVSMRVDGLARELELRVQARMLAVIVQNETGSQS